MKNSKRLFFSFLFRFIQKKSTLSSFLISFSLLLALTNCKAPQENNWQKEIRLMSQTICAKEIQCYKQRIEDNLRHISKRIQNQVKPALPAHQTEMIPCMEKMKSAYYYNKKIPKSAMNYGLIKKCHTEWQRITCEQILYTRELPESCKTLQDSLHQSKP